MNKKLSIIIPVYNAADYIDKCMASILAQVQPEYEILLINDGSTDNSKEIIQGYQERYPDFVRAISKANEGCAKTRDYGIREARGQYICFIDNDDSILPDYFETFLNAIDNSQYDIVIGGYKRVSDDAVLFTVNVPKKESIWAKYMVITPWAKIFRRQFLIDHNIQFLNYGIGEDLYFNMACYVNNARVKNISYNGYRWYFNTKSISNTAQTKITDDTDPLLLLKTIYEMAGQEQVVYICWYIKTGIYYLLTCCKQGEPKEFIRHYHRIFDWYQEKNIRRWFPMAGPITYGERFSVKAIINIFLLLDRLHLVPLFARIYCAGKSDEV